ncbi:hypothetical protein Tco_0854585 [Tanacetum coccineum]
MLVMTSNNVTFIASFIPLIMEYLVKISKKARILELKQRYLKITILTSNTSYPLRKIRHIFENGPLVWPTIALENGIVRPKTYEELSDKEKLQVDCDLKATNIVLQGLPPDIYALVNHHKVAKDIWDRVKLLMQGTSLSKQERECKLYDEFDKFSYMKGHALPTFLPGDDLIAFMNKAMAFLSAMVESPFSKFKEDKGRMLLVQVHKAMLQEKVLLVQAQAKAFQNDDLDAYDFDCDDISSSKAVRMANLSSCDSDVLSEMSNRVTNWDKANNESKIVNESLPAELDRYME